MFAFASKVGNLQDGQVTWEWRCYHVDHCFTTSRSQLVASQNPCEVAVVGFWNIVKQWRLCMPFSVAVLRNKKKPPFHNHSERLKFER